MNVSEKITTRLSNILTPKRVALILGIFFVLTMLPILYVAPAVRATGDDLGYSYSVHDALTQGLGLTGVIRAVISNVKGTWYSWQGTWSSVALFCLQPGIWGEEWYPITVAVSLTCILVGTGYFLFVILKRFGLPSSCRWMLFFLAAVLIIQYMPNVRAGIYWWTSVAHYCIPYGVTMMCMGWSLRWLETGKWRFWIGSVIGMTYLGGAGYPEVVLGAVWFFLLIVGTLLGLPLLQRQPGSTQHKAKSAQAVFTERSDLGCGNSKYDYDSSSSAESPDLHSVENAETGNKAAVRIRSLLLLVPLILEMIGFAISAIAPGNTNRGGEGFGFSISNVIYTLITCVKEGLAGIAGYCLSVRPLLPVLLLIAVFAYELTQPHTAAQKADPTKGTLSVLHWWQPALLTLVCLGICCIVRAPEIYAGTDVSGGVPDSYWFVTMTMLTVCIAGDAAWLKRFRLQCRSADKSYADSRSAMSAADTQTRHSEGNISAASDKGWHYSPVIFAAVALFCLLMYRHIIGSTVDYTCVNFVTSGAYADYDEQMTEWIELLNDPDTTDVELPAMNSEQGPFMMMVPLEETGNFSNSVYENYYHKNSVISVPRN